MTSLPDIADMGGLIPRATTVFDTLRREHADGSEYWSARDLMGALGYSRWENFHTAITRSVEACAGAEQPTDTHFRATTKKVQLGGTAARDVLDYHLTRYAAYLTAMNSDPSKGSVALAQTYFAAQTRAAEVMRAQALNDEADPVLAQLALLTQVRRQQLATAQQVEAHALQLAQVREELDHSPILGAQLRTVFDLGQRLGQLMGDYRRAWRLFKDRFGLASYRDLPRCQYDQALHFLRLQIAAYTGTPIEGTS